MRRGRRLPDFRPRTRPAADQIARARSRDCGGTFWRYGASANGAIDGAVMATATKRKTSVTIDAAALDAARDLGLDVSAVADAALQKAVTEARRGKWLDENAEAFARQAEWHERNDHPLVDILVAPAKATWSG